MVEMLNRLDFLNIPEREREVIKKKYYEAEAKILRKMRIKLKAGEFESIKIIGRGAFGEVRLC